MRPKHEAHGNGVYVGRVVVAEFNSQYDAKKFADFANLQQRSETENNTKNEVTRKERENEISIF